MEQDVIAALHALTKGSVSRSATARLADILPAIEDALRAGVRRTEIVATLNARGFALTLRSFETAVYRLRLRQRQTDTPSTRDAHGPRITAPAPADTNPPQETPKQRRERLGAEFINESNPLIDRITKKMETKP